MPLFHKEPNLCASIFNEELHASIGNHRVIRLFKHFTATGRLWHGGLGGASPAICTKFYVSDGLHFNMTGSKLLGALISQFIFKDKEARSTQNVPYMCEKPTASIRSSASALIQETAYVPQPHIVFSDTSPPPPSTDLNQYPPLPGSERVGFAEHALLTGYSDAASKVPLSQKNEKRTSCNRKCKFLVLIFYLFKTLNFACAHLSCCVRSKKYCSLGSFST